MNSEIAVLAGVAASIGFLHTLFGPDHYLPFIVMSKARNWSVWKTSWITILCGIGHVGSSIVIGAIGIIFGIGVSKLTFIEGFRGNIAAWFFIIFGLIYFLWGIYRAVKNKPHKHIHFHEDGVKHEHFHTHQPDGEADEHSHNHLHKTEKPIRLTPWVLFTIFVLGPCEPLIPVLMYPAFENNTGGLILITSIFSLVTIATMLTIVLILSSGYKLLPLGKIERYTHAIAGFIILMSGVAIQLGL